MNWLKKSQYNYDMMIVKKILDENLNGSVDDVRAKIESISGICLILESLCQGSVPAFYMTVFSSLCAQDVSDNSPVINEQIN